MDVTLLQWNALGSIQTREQRAGAQASKMKTTQAVENLS